MFGRRPPPRQSPPRSGAPLGYHTETILVADPDVAVLHRDRALRHTIGLGLQGYSGVAVGYDRGDPGMSATGPLSLGEAYQPTQAIGHVGRIADATRMAPVPEIADLPTSDPALDPYMANLWNRISR